MIKMNGINISSLEFFKNWDKGVVRNLGSGGFAFPDMREHINKNEDKLRESINKVINGTGSKKEIRFALLRIGQTIFKLKQEQEQKLLDYYGFFQIGIISKEGTVIYDNGISVLKSICNILDHIFVQNGFIFKKEEIPSLDKIEYCHNKISKANLEDWTKKLNEEIDYLHCMRSEGKQPDPNKVSRFLYELNKAIYRFGEQYSASETYGSVMLLKADSKYSKLADLFHLIMFTIYALPTEKDFQIVFYKRLIVRVEVVLSELMKEIKERNDLTDVLLYKTLAFFLEINICIDPLLTFSKKLIKSQLSNVDNNSEKVKLLRKLISIFDNYRRLEVNHEYDVTIINYNPNDGLERFVGLLNDLLDEILLDTSEKDIKDEDPLFVWQKSDTAFIELVVGLIETKSISPLPPSMTQKDIIESMGKMFGVELNNIDNIIYQLFNRKNPALYTEKLKGAIEERGVRNSKKNDKNK